MKKSIIISLVFAILTIGCTTNQTKKETTAKSEDQQRTVGITFASVGRPFRRAACASKWRDGADGQLHAVVIRLYPRQLAWRFAISSRISGTSSTGTWRITTGWSPAPNPGIPGPWTMAIPTTCCSRQKEQGRRPLNRPLNHCWNKINSNYFETNFEKRDRSSSCSTTNIQDFGIFFCTI